MQAVLHSLTCLANEALDEPTLPSIVVFHMCVQYFHGGRLGLWWWLGVWVKRIDWRLGFAVFKSRTSHTTTANKGRARKHILRSLLLWCFSCFTGPCHFVYLLGLVGALHSPCTM